MNLIGGSAMNKNLLNLFDRLINDLEIRKKFSKQENLEDLYKICLSVEVGYNLDEFKEFLKVLISLNKKISNKMDEISEEGILDVAGGFNLTKVKSRVSAALMGSILLTGVAPQSKAYEIKPSNDLQNSILINQSLEDNESLETKIEKIKCNASESTKQALQTLASTAEKCVGSVLDVISTPASASDIQQKKVKPTIYSWPQASKITVGQKIGDSKLCGGSASVDGKFSWLPVIEDEKVTNSGRANYICQFIPDDLERYSKVTQSISLEVLEAETEITSYPTASTITYGQKLSDSTLSGGYANVHGKFSWADPYTVPSVGTHSYQVLFTPNNPGFKSKTFNIEVNVNKSTPHIYSWPTASSITDGETISNSHLSSGSTNVAGEFSWAENSVKPRIGTHECMVKFTPNDSNYKSIYKNISVNVNKVDVQIKWPEASSIKYGQKLSDSKLCGGSSNIPGHFEWDSSESHSKPSAGISNYRVVFKPDNSLNYSSETKYTEVKVEKAKPIVLVKPLTSDINYGEPLCKSLIGGCVTNTLIGNVNWKNGGKILDAGAHMETAIIKPYDTNNFKSIAIDLPVTVKQAPVNVNSFPIASSITYGQTLSSSEISNFHTSIPGTVSWSEPNKILSAGHHVSSITFTPYDSHNYKALNIPISVTVNKVTPQLKDKDFKTAYKRGMTLGDISLPAGWKWQTPNAPIDDINKFKFLAVHEEDNNNYKNSETVFINVHKAEPTLSLSDITYNENMKLKDIKLPAGWHWIDENETPIASKSTYKASFDSKEAGTRFYYDRNEINLNLKVNKANPKVKTWATPTHDIIYGDDLNYIQLGGGEADVPGKFYISPDKDLKAGQYRCKITFIPDNPSYKTVNDTISIEILKNMNPAEPPKDLSDFDVTREDRTIKFEVSEDLEKIEFSKDGGKTWQSSPKFTRLSPKTEYHFVHRYKDTESRCASKMSSVLKLSTKASAPEAPKELKLKKRTNHEIIFEGNDDLEFSKNGGVTWQNSPEFKDLRSNTQYTFVARVKDDYNHMASALSKQFVVKTRSRFSNIIRKIFRL